jgi:hypothetical protein
MRRLTKIGLGVSAAVMALVLAAAGYFIFVFGWPPPDCGPESTAVAKARSLSGAELAHLYDEMSDLVRLHPTAHSVPAELWPPSVAALHPRNVSADLSPRVTLEGCFDHYVFLRFEGIPGELTPSERKVLLSWGEGSDSGVETLWQP